MRLSHLGVVVLLSWAWLGLTAVSTVSAETIGSLWASDALAKVLRSELPPTDAARHATLQLAGGRGETVSAQAAFRPTADCAAVRATVTELRHRDTGAVIRSERFRLQWVRYIDVGRNTAGVPDDELVAKAPTSLPDPYWEEATVPVAAEQTQPIWIELSVPTDAAAGIYEGTLSLDSGEETWTLPMTLHVWNFELPAERHLSVINWAQFPGAAYAERAEPDSPAYYRLYHDFCTFLVRHRQTDVMGRLDWIVVDESPDGEVTCDTSQFERHAETAFAAGIRQIHLHAAGQKTASILDPVSRVEIPEQRGGPRRMSQLAALEDAVTRRGWQHRVLVAITDEPFIHHEESFAEAVATINRVAPSVRTVEAVETEYLGPLDIYVPKLSHLNLWYPHFDRLRREEARELWYYTCCHPTGRYPNRFLDQSLLKVRVLHWLNYLYDLRGYLHWGLNFYGSDDPYSEDGISKGLPLGDRAIVYPGASGWIGSLRFSAQRDGLQDYEYLWLLADRLQEVKQEVGADAFWLDPRQRSLELCRRVIWTFHDYTRDPDVLFATRAAVAEEIEALQSGPRLIVQTSPPEGTPIPAGPRMVNVRGLVAPGATVWLNDKQVVNVRPSGYFAHYCFLDKEPTVRVTVRQEGRERTVERTFPLP